MFSSIRRSAPSFVAPAVALAVLAALVGPVASPAAGQEPPDLPPVGGPDLDPIETPDVDAPAPPTGLLGLEVGGLVFLGWVPNDEADIGDYVVFRSASRNGRTQVVAITTANGLLDTSPRAGDNYYTVVARDTAGNLSAPSASVIVRSGEPPSVRGADGESLVAGTVIGDLSLTRTEDGESQVLVDDGVVPAEHRWTIPAGSGRQSLRIVAAIADLSAAEPEPGDPTDPDPGDPTDQDPGDPTDQDPGDPTDQDPGDPTDQDAVDPGEDPDDLVPPPGAPIEEAPSDDDFDDGPPSADGEPGVGADDSDEVDAVEDDDETDGGPMFDEADGGFVVAWSDDGETWIELAMVMADEPLGRTFVLGDHDGPIEVRVMAKRPDLGRPADDAEPGDERVDDAGPIGPAGAPTDDRNADAGGEGPVDGSVDDGGPVGGMPLVLAVDLLEATSG